jgi:hypothetical protein
VTSAPQIEGHIQKKIPFLHQIGRLAQWQGA